MAKVLRLKPGLTAHLATNRLFIHKALYERMGKPRKLKLEFYGKGSLQMYPDVHGVSVQKTSEGAIFVRPRSYVVTPGKHTFFNLVGQVGERFKLGRVEPS